MLTEYVPVLSFMGYVYAAARVGGIAMGLAPFVVLCALLLTGYVASFVHCFTLVHHVLVMSGCAAGLAAFAFACWKKTNSAANTADIRIVGTAFCGLMLYFSWYYSGVLLSYYDEFFWGAFAKSLFHEGGLWTSLSALARDDMTQAYPPMPAILANTFMPLSGPFTEHCIAMGGMALVLATGSMAYHYSYERLGRPQALCLAFIVACIVRTVGAKCEGYYLVGYADYLQGALFACLLFVAVFENSLRRKLLLLMLGLPMLALCKQTGIVLCLCVMASALLQLYTCSTKFSARQWSAALCAMLLPTLLSYGAWAVYTNMFIVQPSGNSSLLDFKAAWADPLLWPSFKAYLWAFVERPLLVSPSLGWLNYATGTLAFIVLGGVMYALARRWSQPWDTTFRLQLCLLLTGALGWIALHWYAGFVFFVEPDLYDAACYERYIGPYIGAVWAVFLVLFFVTLAKKIHNGTRITVMLLLTAAAFVVVCSMIPWERPAARSLTPVRQKIEQAAHYLEQHTPVNSKIYFVPDGGSTEEEWALRYMLLPIRKGTSLVPQALVVAGHPRPTVKKFLVPPPAEREQLFREHRVDYIFLLSQGANFFDENNDSSLSYPYLLRLNTTK